MDPNSDKEATPRKGRDKRQPLGNNLVWLLTAVAAVVLLVVFAVPLRQELDLPYGKLIELIEQGAPSTHPDASIRVDGLHDGLPATYTYSHLSDLKIGPEEILGKVDREVVSRSTSDSAQETVAGPLEPKAQVTFRTGRRGFEFDSGSLESLLRKNGFSDFRGEEKPSTLSTYAPMLIFTGFMVLMLWMFLRRMGGAGSPMAFGRSRAKMYAQEDIGVTFEDVAGIDEAVDELREVVEFLRSPEKFQTLGGRIPKGVLLVGPPGTGKTLLAKAIAGEASVPFFSLSGSDFVEMFVGVGAARVRDMFQQAEAKSPCIIFIDELDALGKTRGSSVVGGHDEREQTLNALLVEMDGFASNNGVIVLAATNRPETLDPALLRPGRFDRHVLVDRPDVRGREKILEVHVQNVKLDTSVSLKEVARITSGFVGADLGNLVNEAALLAAQGEDCRRHGRVQRRRRASYSRS